MKNNYICNVPCLRSSIAYDHDFWYTSVKWWYLQVFWVFFSFFFLFFLRFSFFRLLGGKRAKNGSRWQKNLVNFISQEPYITWLSFMVHLCKMMISPSVFFIFSKFWFSGLLGGGRGEGVKGQKMVQENISRIIHHMIFIYGTHV